MEKIKNIKTLYDNIKTNLELDRDIVALEKLLSKLIYLNLNLSLETWKETIEDYDINSLSLDLDFEPLLLTYPNKIISKKGLKYFLSQTKDLSNSKKNLIYRNVFNIYNDDCILYFLIEDTIITNDIKKETELINLILNNTCNLSLVFDCVKFLEDVITLHLNSNHRNLKFLRELTEIPENPKEKSLLKTLLIDCEDSL